MCSNSRCRRAILKNKSIGILKGLNLPNDMSKIILSYITYCCVSHKCSISYCYNANKNLLRGEIIMDGLCSLHYYTCLRSSCNNTNRNLVNGGRLLGGFCSIHINNFKCIVCHKGNIDFNSEYHYKMCHLCRCEQPPGFCRNKKFKGGLCYAHYDFAIGLFATFNSNDSNNSGGRYDYDGYGCPDVSDGKT